MLKYRKARRVYKTKSSSKCFCKLVILRWAILNPLSLEKGEQTHLIGCVMVLLDGCEDSHLQFLR